MGKYFGTDGFRGEANVGLTADHAYKVGRFLGWYYGERLTATTSSDLAIARPPSPQGEGTEERIATPVCALARNDTEGTDCQKVNCRKAAREVTLGCGSQGESRNDTEDVALPGGAGQKRLPTQSARIVSRHCRPRIVIGKDTRRSSYMFEYALAAGITASGGDAYLLHVTTTPSVAYVTRTDEFDCGVMISASHNPFYDNGIKLLNRQGEKMDEATIAKVEDYLDGKIGELPFATGADIGRTVDYVAGRNRYVGYLISLGLFSFKNFRVALDCANGAAWTIAKSVFEALGAKVYVLGAEPDGVNINENAGSTHIENLQRFVVEKGMDVGFAYDGDADRCLCVDEAGNIVTGDHILYVLGKYMREQGQLDHNTVVTTVMSNFGLYKAFDREGIEYAQTAVGDKYVYEYMAANGCRLGGEQSGHIIISKYATTGDGILTSLKVMEVMLEKKLPLSALCRGFSMYPQVLKNVRVQDKEKALSDPKVLAAIREAEQALGDTGRILVRPSGTEPVVRVMAEAASAGDCEKWVERVVGELTINN